MVMETNYPDNIWVYLCIAAILFTGIRGFQRKRHATLIIHHQHLHLISTITTTIICAFIIAIRQPEIPSEYILFIILCFMNGVGYALAGVCNYGAVKHLKLSTFQSVSKLSAFLPIVVFYYILGEKISSIKLIGILLTIFPIMMLTYIEPDESSDEKKLNDIKKGVSFLILYLLITSSMQIINVITVKSDINFSIGADPFLFIMCSNALSLPYMMIMIVRARERFNLSSNIFKAGVSAGLVNTLSFSAFLLALSLGPASVIVPLYAYNAFISTTLLKAFPISQTEPMQKKSIVILSFLIGWSIISIAILIFGDGS